jgi:hypothetical protein
VRESLDARFFEHLGSKLDMRGGRALHLSLNKETSMRTSSYSLAAQDGETPTPKPMPTSVTPPLPKKAQKPAKPRKVEKRQRGRKG